MINGKKMINELIVKRKSIKQFGNANISDSEILTLFEAARRAPSAFNEQPWRFILAKRESEKEFNAILNTLSEKNRDWAKDSSLFVTVLSKKILTRSGKPNRHYMYDTASAVANLTFQALTLNLYVHQMGGFDMEKLIKEFVIPPDFEPAVILAIGKMKNGNEDESTIHKGLNRLPVEEIVFEKKFGKESDIAKIKSELIN